MKYMLLHRLFTERKNSMAKKPKGPSNAEVEAAARAYMEWQFNGRTWETTSESLKAKFRDGARRALTAAAMVSQVELAAS